MLRRFAVSAFWILFLGWHSIQAEAFRLKDGSLLYGEVTHRNDSGIFLQTRHLGLLIVNPGDLQCTGDAALAAGLCSSEKVWADPEDRSLFFMPTAFTPPKGTFQFKDLELYFLNFGFSPTGSTQISGGMLFPITLEFQFFTLDVMQRIALWEGEHSRAAIALNGSLSRPVGDAGSPFTESYNANVIFSFRAANHTNKFQDGYGFHFLAGNLWSLQDKYADYYLRRVETWKSDIAWGAGFEARLTKHVKFIAEYRNTAPFQMFRDDDFNGLATFGLRIHGAQLSADIAGVRPLTENDLDGLFVLPLLTMAYRFGG